MFTGIVEEMATLVSRDGGRFVFEADAVTDGLGVGDSLAHNGCCLTIVEHDGNRYAVDVVAESLSRTNLDRLQAGERVNVERPMRADGRFDGHIVQGHVDGVGTVIHPAPNLRIEAPESLMPYIVQKGSIAIDGCSLTVVDLFTDGFTVAVIPHTAEVTTIGRRRRGDLVNLEVDILAKYVERMLATGRAGTSDAVR